MQKCGCVGLRVNNDSIIKYCPLHAAAPDLLKALTEGIGVEADKDFAGDLEEIASILGSGFPTAAHGLLAKAQAIRAALADARGEAS